MSELINTTMSSTTTSTSLNNETITSNQPISPACKVKPKAKAKAKSKPEAKAKPESEAKPDSEAKSEDAPVDVCIPPPSKEKKPKTKTNTKVRAKPPSLQPYYDIVNQFEIGVDEAGRGPLFGRLYVAAAILPKDDSFRHGDIRDSKKYTSKTKITELSDYIKANSVAWAIHYIEADEIDKINIRQAVLKAMHECIRQAIQSTKGNVSDYFLLIDGNDFRPYTIFDETTGELQCYKHETIEGGDNLYTPIAAASILAKVARDEYVAELCEKHPELDARYKLSTNMGYGTKLHLDGILEHGITQWHRRSYGRCKEADYNLILEESFPCGSHYV